MSSSISSTLLTARSLLLLQLTTRLLTFTLNQTLVRLAPPEVFGTAAIQFDLLCSTILFLSREGIRNALLRTKAIGSSQDKRLAVLPVQLGMGVTTVLLGIYLYSLPESTSRQAGFYMALGLYILGSMVELLVEPLYLRALRSTPPKMGVRVQAEGGMAIVKSLVTVGMMLLNPSKALLAFACGQISGALWLAGRYVWEYGLGDIWISRSLG